MNIFNSIKFKFTLGVFLLIVVITAIFGVLSYEYGKRAIQERVYAQLNATADLKKEIAVNYINERINNLKTMATSEYMRQSIFSLSGKRTSVIPEAAQYKFIRQRLEAFKNLYHDYLSIEVTDIKGNIIVSTDDDHHSSGSRHEHKKSIDRYIEVIKTGCAVIMQDYLNSEEGHLDFALGIRNANGSINAVLISSIALKNILFPTFSDYTGLGLAGETLLVKTSDEGLMHINPTRHQNNNMKKGATYGKEHFKLGLKAASGNEGIDEAIDYRDKKVIGAYRYIPILNWGIVVKMDMDEAFKEITELRKNIFIFGMLILGIMLIVSYLIVNKLTAPIADIAQKTMAIASGDYSIRIKSKRKDEIGNLERNFDAMADALDNSKAMIESKQTELEKINHELEQRVTERTQELSDANTALLKALENIKKETAEKKKLEEMLLHAQKMEAIGQLAGGIAHDFNNILTAIIGFGSLMLMNMKEDDPNRSYLKEMLSAGEKATHLTQGLLAFSRKQIINPMPVDLNDVIKSMEKLLKRILREDIELKTALSDKDLFALVDSGQIEQVLMNLTTNARDAMPHGGILTISTEVANLNNEFIKTHGYGEIGKYALISVSDTGMGMDKNTKERIFEPFFTTKEFGRGTGLGLAIVYGIIKQHNGYINCYSEPGRGTIFRIYLPLIKSKTEKIEQAAIPELRGGTETVLIAEDDTAISKLIKGLLQEFGYTVIDAKDGEDAVHKFVENKDMVQILLLDVVMPRKNGKETFEEIKKIKPGIKAIFMSGYTADIINEKGILEEGINFIPKPISPHELLRKVREILDK
ncbi:MAG: ATP-binding protein [Nitrospirae bacterium]|nr:ATP-binding protein [Nitrospirota bacterium]MDA8215048.1 ATP-binding protein [Nitrospiraceae bacterium]